MKITVNLDETLVLAMVRAAVEQAVQQVLPDTAALGVQILERMRTVDLQPAIQEVLSPLLRQQVMTLLSTEMGINPRQVGGMKEMLRGLVKEELGKP